MLDTNAQAPEALMLMAGLNSEESRNINTYISEVIVFKSVLTEQQRKNVEDYFTQKYAKIPTCPVNAYLTVMFQHSCSCNEGYQGSLEFNPDDNAWSGECQIMVTNSPEVVTWLNAGFSFLLLNIHF